MQLVTLSGTGEDCAMAGFHAVRYFRLPGDWRINGFIGRTRDGFSCRWMQAKAAFSTVGEAESWLQAESGCNL